MLACATENGLSMLGFSDRMSIEENSERLQNIFSSKLINKPNKIIDQLSSELDEYFNGERREFSIPLSIRGSRFQMRVWRELTKIPYGKTRTYKEQANSIGNLKAIRAVAAANGDNRIAIIIPCHRVIGSDGSLTGYAGKIWRKRFLLNLERSNMGNLIDKNGQTAMW